MERALVLTNESACHPLRQLLPPPEAYADVADTTGGLRLFLITYCAGFLFFSALIG